MTENTPEVANNDISPVVTEYERWKEYGKKMAIDQALHPATLNNTPWVPGATPKDIAEFTLREAKNEALEWIDDRKDCYWLEEGEYYDKVRQVRREIRKILRNRKE